MKIVLLSGYNVIHTVRWANSLCERGHDVHLISLHRRGDTLDPRVKKVILPFPPPLGYYLNIPFIRYILQKIKPDLVNAHYASGYGTLGRLSGFHPYVLSVWGSDVYDFPHYSDRNRKLIVKNLLSADIVCSTSYAMAKVTKKLCPGLGEIYVTPFGVDTKRFVPKASPVQKTTLTIGTIKKLRNKYGIDILIRSFAAMKENIREINPGLSTTLRLMIVGEGVDKDDLVKLAADIGVGDVTEFVGAIPYADVPGYLKSIDIYAALSRLDSESFGVAIIEASACGLPVVVSDTDGPSEVVNNESTGLIVPRENVTESAMALERLVIDSSLRHQLGTAGRSHVVDTYDWEKSVDIMENVYNKVAGK